jgi:hypothetical protein
MILPSGMSHECMTLCPTISTLIIIVPKNFKCKDTFSRIISWLCSWDNYQQMPHDVGYSSYCKERNFRHLAFVGLKLTLANIWHPCYVKKIYGRWLVCVYITTGLTCGVRKMNTVGTLVWSLCLEADLFTGLLLSVANYSVLQPPIIPVWG